MDRRRRTGFRPSIDDLEARQVMTTLFTPTVPKLPQGVSLATNQQKLTRIERLPYFLQALDRNRPLPLDLVTQIQSDLTALKGKLHQPPSALLEAFNKELRSLISEGSVRATDAARLNAIFGEVLLKAGTEPKIAASLQSSLTTLTQLDISAGDKPTSLVANDYATVLQTALGVGRPLRAPTVPRLAPADDSDPKNDWATVVRQPHLIGSYDAGTTVTLYDTNGQSYGSAAVSPSGQYTIAVDHPLPAGRNTLLVQANDNEGALSLPSRTFPLKILTPVPRGPMAQARSSGG